LKVAEKDGDRYLVINTTKQALEQAPGYTYDRTKSVANQIVRWWVEVLMRRRVNPTRPFSPDAAVIMHA
jgi:hypothetical protein